MDGMADRLQELLGDENTIRQIQQVVASLQGGGPQSAEAAPRQETGGGLDPAVMSGLLSMLPGMLGGGSGGGGGTGDPNVALLQSLRPFLSSKRKKRVNEAVRIMKLMDMLPLLQQSGLLSGILGGGDDGDE